MFSPKKFSVSLLQIFICDWCDYLQDLRRELLDMKIMPRTFWSYCQACIGAYTFHYTLFYVKWVRLEVDLLFHTHLFFVK
jgi:hypothetical protein